MHPSPILDYILLLFSFSPYYQPLITNPLVLVFQLSHVDVLAVLHMEHFILGNEFLDPLIERL